jgi:hypothetical protein
VVCLEDPKAWRDWTNFKKTSPAVELLLVCDNGAAKRPIPLLARASAAHVYAAWVNHCKTGSGDSHILLLVRVLRLAWEDISGKSGKHERLVKAWLEVRGCRWLNFAGLVTVGAGAVFLWIAGDFPQQLWFLHAAIVVGFLDILGKDRLLELPGHLPTPRVADLVAPEVPEVAGKQCSFAWHPWSDDLIALSCEQTFPIRTDEYNNPRSRERFPTAEVRNLARYVRDGHCDSVAQVIVFFRRRSIEQALTAEQEMEDVVCFARSVAYVPDMETRGVEDWANFPVETL